MIVSSVQAVEYYENINMANTLSHVVGSAINHKTKECGLYYTGTGISGYEETIYTKNILINGWEIHKTNKNCEELGYTIVNKVPYKIVIKPFLVFSLVFCLSLFVFFMFVAVRAFKIGNKNSDKELVKHIKK